MAPWLSPAADGVNVAIKVTPRARRAAIEEPESGGVLLVRVTAPPNDGKANTAVIALLSDAWDVPKSAISIVGGQTSRLKRVFVRGNTAYLLQRLTGRGAVT